MDLANIQREYKDVVLPFIMKHPDLWKPNTHTLELYMKLVAFVMAYRSVSMRQNTLVYIKYFLDPSVNSFTPSKITLLFLLLLFVVSRNHRRRMRRMKRRRRRPPISR